MDQEPIRVVQLGTIVVVETVIVLADEEHRGQRCETEFDIWFSQKKHNRDFDGGLDSRIKIESIGAGRRCAVEQRVDCRLIGVWLGCLDPEFAKKRKFLGGGGPL